MINTKRDRENLYINLNKKNLKRKLHKLLKNQYHARVEDGKFVPNLPVMGLDTPWVYIKSSPARCDIYHFVFFDHLNFIPSYCRNCYKIVIYPRTLVELFDLYEMQRETGYPCKCGVEVRKTSTHPYGGYFYCRGLEQGEERYKEVRALVDKHLSSETPVILKRYCTEFEIGVKGKGPSDQLPEMTPEEIEFEKYVLDHFPPVGYKVQQPEYLTAGVMIDWIEFAYKQGDQTYKEFTGGRPVYAPVVTYHEEKERPQKVILKDGKIVGRKC